tara:strand:+ start:89 stop:238 length:150 start_codon:yes stop_codon:yes gene_type:complete
MAITKITLVKSMDQMRKIRQGNISILLGQNLTNKTKSKSGKAKSASKKD